METTLNNAIVNSTPMSEQKQNIYAKCEVKKREIDNHTVVWEMDKIQEDEIIRALTAYYKHRENSRIQSNKYHERKRQEAGGIGRKPPMRLIVQQ